VVLDASSQGNNQSNIVRTTTGGSMTVVTNNLTFDSESSLMVGPDHNVWGSTPYTVYSLAENGTFCAVGTPSLGAGDGVSGDSGVRALTLGPDGNVWFLATGSHLIGRFNVVTAKAATFARPHR
jgi:hypothetical protein